MEEKTIGYLKYKGKAVESGLLDIQKSSEALAGFAEIIKYFLVKEDSQLANKELDIPVRIKQGSWETIIPEMANRVFTPEGIGYATATAFFTKTAMKAADVGIFQTGLAKDINKVLKSVLISAQWTLRIAIHFGTMTKVKFEKVKWRKNNAEVGIPNQNGDYLYVPKKYLDAYQHCPKDLFSKVVKIVEIERELEIGVYESNEAQRVCITNSEKEIFYTENEEEILFPELIQGNRVELEGVITRVNEKTNTIGFEYLGHILTCKPVSGSIVNFKDDIVSQDKDKIYYRAILFGTVDRFDYDGVTELNRPKIIFDKITPIETEGDDDQLSLI